MPDFKEKYEDETDRASDTSAAYYFGCVKSKNDIKTDAGVNEDQLATIIAQKLGGNPDPDVQSLFVLTQIPNTLGVNVGPVTGVSYIAYAIIKNDSVAPIIGDVRFKFITVPTSILNFLTGYGITDTSILYVHDGVIVTKFEPNQTITATTTNTIPQTPNDVNFPALINVITSATLTSNVVQISGLIAPTAISISGGTNAKYSKNGNIFTASAGVIENNDTIQLQQDASGSDSTSTTITVSLGLRDEDWTVTTAATGVTPGVISIVAASYSGAENSTITIDLARTGGSDGIVGCRVSTLFVQDYHTAQDGVNYIKIDSEIVTFADSDIAESVTITNIPAGLTLNVAGELIILSGSEFGGATIDPDLDATLFAVDALAAGSAFDIFLGDTGTKWMAKVNLRDAVDLSRATNTPGGVPELSWTEIESPAVAFQSTPISHAAPDTEDATAALSFDVDITQAGTYFFHLKAAGVSVSQDQCRISIDNGAKSSYRVNTADGVYAWGNNFTYNLTFTLDVGVHTITIHNKENTFGIEEILFVLSSVYNWSTEAEGEAYSAYPTSAGGDDPANPLIPLGPPLVIDDKTPDPFPFGSKIDVATSATNIESIPVLIQGITVPTEIGIVAGSDASAEYEIDDSASWVTADGLVVNGSIVACRLDASSSNSTTVSMSLKIGTVTHTFSVVTISATAPGLTPVTSTINVTLDSQTIEDKDIQIAAGGGDGIYINPGVTGTIIRNCRISSVDGHAIHADSIGTVEVHNVDVMNCWGSGVYLRIFDSANIHDNNFENIHTAVDLWNGRAGNITVKDNWIKNMFNRPSNVPSMHGGGIALRYCLGPSILIDGNIIINVPGQSDIEDKINLYSTSGVAASPIWIKNNKLNGKSDSLSDSTIIIGDQGGSYTLVEDNIMVNAGQTGCGMNDGHTHTFRRNKILCVPLYAFTDPSLGISNVGFAPGVGRLTNNVYPTHDIVFEDNDMTFWKAANYDNRGNVEALDPYWFAEPTSFSSSDIAGWSTNRFDTATSQPASLVEADIWDTAWDIKPTRLA